VVRIKPLPGKPRTLSAIHPNAGIEAEYRQALDREIAEMQADLVKELTASYSSNEPRALAMDATPAQLLNSLIQRLTKKWLSRFEKLGPKLGFEFADKAAGRTDAGLKAALKKAGLTVKFTMTPAQRDAVDAVKAENVGLIKSIASEHLTDVQGILMRSVSRGRDLGGMVKELEDRYAITRRRAALIARDQNNKATAVIVRARQRELGISEAIWMHSTAGKHPRPSHVRMNGKTYLVAEGMYDPDEKRNVLPGELVNCRCLSRAVIPGLS
jgi:SPP1 gp7 family putative phage head morphogenesis protein